MKPLKILFATTPLPYPPNSGSRIRAFNLLRYLASRGEVSLLSTAQVEEDRKHIPALEAICRHVTLVDLRNFYYYDDRLDKKAWSHRIRNVLKPKSWDVLSFSSPEFRRTFLSLGPERFDLIIFRHTPLAQFLFEDKNLKPLLSKTFIDIDDVSARQKERTIQEMKPGYEKFRHRIDLMLLHKFDQNLAKIRGTFVCSRMDQEYMAKFGVRNTYIVPNAVSVNGAPIGISKSVIPEILFCGMLSYPPNAAGIVHFSKEVFPRIRKAIPEAHLTIIGRSPRADVAALGTREGITVFGFVPETQPYYEKASISVVPLRSGSGTRIKILESMMYGCPVVSTSIGAEGLEVTDRENIFIADDPELFAQRCTELIQNQELRGRISENGYQLVKEKYDLPSFNRAMDEVIETFLKERSWQP